MKWLLLHLSKSLLVGLIILHVSRYCAFCHAWLPTDARVIVQPASIPRDLAAIRRCRGTAFSNRRTLFEAQSRFVNADAVARGSVTCLVARERFFPWRILGSADVRTQNNGSIYVNNVYVIPAERGQGLGKRLMDLVERFGQETGKRTQVVLEVDVQNRAAVSLYLRCGYGYSGIHAATAWLGTSTGFPCLVEMNKTLP